ncbi:hypothetical protein Q7P37_002909 [Cladosporium fusiforme]
MSLKPVFTKNAPAPRPVYSQAIVANNLVFCSGQLPKDPSTNKLIQGDVEACTHQCIANLKAVLEEAGSSLDHAIEVNVFLSDIADFATMNKAYGQYWGGDGHRPARTCVAVKTLPENASVEIKCVALQIPSRASRL